jgi:hypothetical protein
VDGEVVSWRWSFGDGTSSDERNPVHTYAAAGTYNVTLEITDDQGAANAWSISVSVREAAPQLLDYWPVIVGILAVILLALVTLLWRRRRERKAGEPPPDSGTG